MGPLASVSTGRPQAWDLTGSVVANAQVASGLWRLDLALPRAVAFQPGQFAMLNLCGPVRLIFRRPLSILGGDDSHLSFLYRLVGRGTALLAELRPAAPVACLAPLGRPFPTPEQGAPPALILAGGVGLPPLYAWWRRHGRSGDLACFGARDGFQAPWPLLPESWHISVERPIGLPAGRSAHAGRVTELALRLLAADCEGAARLVLACGPLPMLRAAAQLAAARRWPCWVSVEERMGCGYGVCAGCVVPLRGPRPGGWRFASSCSEGPVFDAAVLDWDRFAGGDKETP